MFEILTNRAVIYISGLDSRKFLQRLVTNNIATKAYTYNYLLNNQGRYLYDFFVYCENENSYFLDVENANSTDLIKHFLMYKLRSDVKIEDVSSLYVVTYSNTKLEESLFSLQDPRYNKLGFRTIIKYTNISSLSDEVKGLYLKDKYNFAIIDGYIDLIKEKSIPIEFGAEELSAIDYKKGCYIGQEVISRAKYQGEVRKKIFKIKRNEAVNVIEPNVIEQNSQVMSQSGDIVGKICSFYNNQAIALLRIEKYLGLDEKKVIINGHICDVTIPLWR